MKEMEQGRVSDVTLVKLASGYLHPIESKTKLFAFLLQVGTVQSVDFAWVKEGGRPWSTEVLCRVNSACMTSEVFECQRCDCNWQLHRAMDEIRSATQGIIIYHPSHEGRGHGILTKLETFDYIDGGGSILSAYQQLGLNDDVREYKAAAFILNYFEISSIKLLTNNLEKVTRLKELGIHVVERIPLIYNEDNLEIISYLYKKSKQTNQNFDCSDISDHKGVIY